MHTLPIYNNLAFAIMKESKDITSNEQNNMKNGEIKSTRKMGHEAHFELADNDDFFGFNNSTPLSGFSDYLAWVVFAVLVLVSAWLFLGYMQQNCLERNGGDITLCQ